MSVRCRALEKEEAQPGQFSENLAVKVETPVSREEEGADQ